jgi:hypothetical protein
MVDPVTQSLTKLQVARAQLVMALDLFVRDKDPISIHCLACGGGEVIEGLAELYDHETFATHILQTQPQINRKKIRKARIQYWNAFKPFSDRKGLQREDEELLKGFDDRQNNIALFIGWWDYLSLLKKLPVAAQVFQAWWFSLNEDSQAPISLHSGWRFLT